MHDPMTVAHEIKWPWKNKHGHRESIFTIWHVDPETDGTDDSCGWFKRAGHGDPKALEQIRKDFAFEFQYWFNEAGYSAYELVNEKLTPITTENFVEDYRFANFLITCHDIG